MMMLGCCLSADEGSRDIDPQKLNCSYKILCYSSAEILASDWSIQNDVDYFYQHNYAHIDRPGIKLEHIHSQWEYNIIFSSGSRALSGNVSMTTTGGSKIENSNFCQNTLFFKKDSVVGVHKPAGSDTDVNVFIVNHIRAIISLVISCVNAVFVEMV